VTDTGWIEKAIALVDHGDIDNHVVKASASAELAALRVEKTAHDNRLKAEIEVSGHYWQQLCAAKDENAAQARQIAALREALEPESIAAIIRRVDGNHNLGAGELGEAIACGVAALSSVPPSSMRIVPVERLQMIQRALDDPDIGLTGNEMEGLIDWLAAAIAGKETA